MELIIAILIAFGFASSESASKMSKEEAVKIFTENKLNDRAEGTKKDIWAEEAGDFIWAEEAGDF
jgi:hypothetical protein